MKRNNYIFKPFIIALSLLLIGQALYHPQQSTAQQANPPTVTDGGYASVIPATMEEQPESAATQAVLSPDGGSCASPAENWTLKAPLPTAVFGPAVASDGAYVYAAGGYGIDFSTQFARYDPISNAWTPLTPLPTAVRNALGVYAEGKVFILGGENLTGVTNLVQIYTIASAAWSSGAPMPGSRQQMGGGYYNGKIYIVGGYSTASTVSASNQTWEYSIASNSWQVKANMPSNVSGPGYGIVYGHLYIIGGRDETGATLLTMHNYDIGANSWSTAAPLLTAINYPGSAVYNNRIWVFGGGAPFRSNETSEPESPEAYAFTQVYDPATDLWQYAPSQNVARSFQAGAVVGNKIISVGGYNAGAVNTVEVISQDLLKVLIIYSDAGAYPEELRRSIRTQAGIGQVDAFNGETGTPTWSQLKFYDIVVPFSNSFFANPTALGDALADYIDLGGIVVGLNFDWYSGYNMAGRWQTDGYSPFNLSASTHFYDDSLGAFSSGSPLMAGVTALNAYYRLAVTLSSGAVQVATWSDGQALIAYKGRVIGINAYLGGLSDKWSGDFGRVIANAGNWLWLGNQTCKSLVCASVNTIFGTLEAADLTQTGRLVRAAPASACDAAKTCPGILGSDSLNYDQYPFFNNTDREQCITVTVDTGACIDPGSIHSSAYLGGYDPANLCTNYLADIGGSPFPDGSYGFNVPAWQIYTIVVSEVAAEPICPSYTLTISAGDCDLDSIMIPLIFKALP
jgi:N-acetylneuraminic acid mutarotase